MDKTTKRGKTRTKTS